MFSTKIHIASCIFFLFKTQRITYGRKTAELKTHQIEERLKEIKKEENTLAETLKELEKSNYENSVKLHNDLQNELKQVNFWKY